MSLKDKWIPIRLFALNTEKDSKAMVPGELTALENGIYVGDGPIQKRYGTERLPRTLALPNGYYAAASGCIGLGTRDDRRELLMLTSDDRLVSYVPEDQNWVQMGYWHNIHIDSKPLRRGTGEQYDGTVCTWGPDGINHTVAWADTRGGVYVRHILDGRQLPEFRLCSGHGRSPTAVTVDGRPHVYFVSGTSPPSLHVAVLNSADPTSREFVRNQLHSALSTAAPYYAVCPDGSAAAASVVVANVTNGMYVGKVIPAGLYGSTSTNPSYPVPITINYPSEIAPAVSVTPDGRQLVIAYHTSASLSGTMAAFLNAQNLTKPGVFDNDWHHLIDSHASVTGPGTVSRVGVVHIPPTVGSVQLFDFQAFAEVSASDRTNRYIRSTTWRTEVDDFTSGELMRHSMLASHPFRLESSGSYVWVHHPSTLQSTDFLVRTDLLNAATDRGLLCGWSRPDGCVPDVSGVLGRVEVVGSKAYRVGTNRELQELAVPSYASSSFADRDLVLTTVDYHPSASFRPADVNGVLHMPGGFLGAYDGADVTEHGILMWSEGGTITTGGGGTLPAGDYSWAVIPEAFDAQGNRYLGGVGGLLQATLTGSTSSGTLDIRTITHTLRDGIRAPGLRFGVYRTGVNGTVFQRVGSVANDVTVDSVRFNDNVSEAVRSTGEVAYASDLNGGVGERMNTEPVSAKHLALVGDRLSLAGLEGRPHTVAHSKLILGGGTAYSEGDEAEVEARGGDITGLYPLDDKLVVLKANRIYAAAAGGPENDASDQTPWPQLELVTSDVGSPEGVAVEVAGTTVQGLEFKSNRGFRLLGRDLSVSDNGGPVRDYDGLTVVAGLDPITHDEARFYTSDGRTLVLNTRYNRWSTFPGQPAVAAVDWQGRPTFAAADGHILSEDTGSFLDGGTPYTMRLELGWIPLADSIQGFGRIRRVGIIGEYHSPHLLRLRARFNYRDDYTYDRTWDPTGSLGLVPYGGGTSGSADAVGYGSGSYGGRDPVYQTSFNMNPQVCQSIGLELSDASPEGRSFDMSEMKLQVAIERERPRLPQRKVR